MSLPAADPAGTDTLAAEAPAPFGVFFGDPTELFDPEFTGIPTVNRVDPADASVSVFDLGIIRGDGIFEATAVHDDVPLAWCLHLERLRLSAQMVELPEPNVEAFDAFTHALFREMGGVAQAQVKVLVTRGADANLSAAPRHTLPGGEPLPTVIAIVDCGWIPRPPEIEIATLEREVFKDSAERAPWLLMGAKTLSYATNMAAKREFERRGAQNAVFLTRDGYVMEGPQSTVVLREGDRVVTPDPRIGILFGTTQRELFAWANGAKGYEVAYEEITADRLKTADAVWIMGGGGVQSVTAIDGEPVKHDLQTVLEINEYLQTQRAAVDAWTAAH
ncbi:aminotransferase class IV [Brevibacterium litoralis]|uniref:aminotransferase class IV n=1 Tax=Brevibacterium litoralis TaxID=3138935 RepID=UPI0032EFC3CB